LLIFTKGANIRGQHCVNRIFVFVPYLSLKNIVSPLKVVTASKGSQDLGLMRVLSLFGPEGNTTR